MMRKFTVAVLGLAAPLSCSAATANTVLAWGRHDEGQCAVPPGLTNVVAISAGDAHSLVLKGDGTIEAWGLNESEQCKGFALSCQ